MGPVAAPPSYAPTSGAPRNPTVPPLGAPRNPSGNPTGPVRSTRDQNSMITNTLALNPDHQRKFEESGKTIRALKEHPKCPQKGHGKVPICLSFFLRGGVCFDNCGTIRESPSGSGRTLDGTVAGPTAA